MKSCINCKYGEEMIFDDCKKCVNEKSVYCGIIVDSRELCREWTQKIENTPHVCHTCKHSFNNTGYECNLAHYTSESKFCLSWEANKK